MPMTPLTRASSVASLLHDLVKQGRPGVRFAVLSTEPFTGVEDIVARMGTAFGLHVVDMRLAGMPEGHMAEGGPVAVATVKELEGVGDALLVLRTDGALAADVRDAVTTYDREDVDRDDVPRVRLCVVVTSGDAGRMRDVVERAIGRGIRTEARYD